MNEQEQEAPEQEAPETVVSRFLRWMKEWGRWVLAHPVKTVLLSLAIGGVTVALVNIGTLTVIVGCSQTINQGSSSENPPSETPAASTPEVSEAEEPESEVLSPTSPSGSSLDPSGTALPEAEPTEANSGTSENPEPSESSDLLEQYRREVKMDDCLGARGSDQWCFLAGFATSYVAWRLNSDDAGTGVEFHNRFSLPSGRIWGNAADWDDAAIDAGLEFLDEPGRPVVPGSVAQWNADDVRPYGFVAFVEDVTYDGDDLQSFVMSDMNSVGEIMQQEPSEWVLREHVVCIPEDCQPYGWPDNFLPIQELLANPPS
ncbi:CHAP domain-containing protein [Candidatus Poriferisocius sp.]|uniref:CHAP domain-containing protein n=1 Tax=Candidatus Poriferisocius sp. TaxID=3101276 RepID=UPI003B011208